MPKQRSKNRSFNGMSYREIQLSNSLIRNKLSNEDKKHLKDNGYKNVGWENVIKLSIKIDEMVNKLPLSELTLGELFLEAERIGNKYLANEEIEETHQRLAHEINEIEQEIDKHFPDTEIEVIDFSQKNNYGHKRQYRTKKKR